MQRRILLDQGSKYCASHFHPVHRAPLGMLQPHLQMLKTASMQSDFHHRKQKEVTRVPGLDCKEDGSTAAQEPPQKIHCQMGGMGRGIVMVQQDAPHSSSWALFSQFLGNLWEGNCGVPLCSHCPLMLKWYCCHMTTCSKESEHHILPNNFCYLHFDRSTIFREPPNRRVKLCFWIIPVNSGLVTCNNLRIVARVPIVESPKHFTAPFHSSDLLTVSETLWHPVR